MECFICNIQCTFERDRLNTQRSCPICKNNVCFMCSTYCSFCRCGCGRICCRACLIVKSYKCKRNPWGYKSYICKTCNNPKSLFTLAANIIRDKDVIFRYTGKKNYIDRQIPSFHLDC